LKPYAGFATLQVQHTTLLSQAAGIQPAATLTDLPSPGVQTSLLQHLLHLRNTTFQYFESPWDMDFINGCSTQEEVKWKLQSNFVIQNSVCVSEKQRAFLRNFVLIQVMYINKIFNF
jgi:hypothetical protein